jgi:hypothetical protein
MKEFAYPKSEAEILKQNGTAEQTDVHLEINIFFFFITMIVKITQNLSVIYKQSGRFRLNA